MGVRKIHFSWFALRGKLLKTLHGTENELALISSGLFSFLPLTIQNCFIAMSATVKKKLLGQKDQAMATDRWSFEGKGDRRKMCN